MLMDRIAACKVYQKDKYTAKSPLEYYLSGKDPAPLHEKTRFLLEFLLKRMADFGEKETYEFVKKELLPRQKEFDDINNLDRIKEFCEKNV